MAGSSDNRNLWDEIEEKSRIYTERKMKRRTEIRAENPEFSWTYPTMGNEEYARVLREFVAPAVKLHVHYIQKRLGFAYLEITTETLAGPPGVYMLDPVTQQLYVEEPYEPTKEEEDILVEAFRSGPSPGHVSQVFREMHPDHELFTVSFASTPDVAGWTVKVRLKRAVTVDGHYVRFRHHLIPWIALYEAAQLPDAKSAKEAWDLIVEATCVSEWARPLEEFGLQTAFPESMALIVPNVEPYNKTLVENLFYEDGPRPFHAESKSESKSGISRITMARLETSDATVEEILASTGFEMTATDHRIQEFAASTWQMGERSFTTRQMLEKLGFDADNPDTVEDFENRVQLQRRVLYDVDFTAEMRQDTGEFTYYRFVEPMLHVVEEVKRARNGKLTLTWTLLSPPIFSVHALKVGRVIYLDTDLMKRVMKGVRRTASNVNLAYELVKEVRRRSNPNNNLANEHIRYDTLFARASITFEGLTRSAAWKRKQSAIKNLKNYLRNLKADGVIAGWKPYEKNGEEVGVKITPIKRKPEKLEGQGKRKALGGGNDA